MAISQDAHNVVVLATGKEEVLTFGFSSFTTAVSFVEQQVTEEAEKADAIREALDEGYNLEGITFQILDVESYLDIYEESDDDE